MICHCWDAIFFLSFLSRFSSLRDERQEATVCTAGTDCWEGTINRRKFKLPSAGARQLSCVSDIFCLIAVNFYKK